MANSVGEKINKDEIKGNIFFERNIFRVGPKVSYNPDMVITPV